MNGGKRQQRFLIDAGAAGACTLTSEPQGFLAPS